MSIQKQMYSAMVIYIEASTVISGDRDHGTSGGHFPIGGGGEQHESCESCESVCHVKYTLEIIDPHRFERRQSSCEAMAMKTCIRSERKLGPYDIDCSPP